MRAVGSKRAVRDTSKMVLFNNETEFKKQLSVENVHCSGADGSM